MEMREATDRLKRTGCHVVSTTREAGESSDHKLRRGLTKWKLSYHAAFETNRSHRRWIESGSNPAFASSNLRRELLGDPAMTFRRHVNSVRLPQAAAKRRHDIAVGFDGPDAAPVQFLADFGPVGLGVGEAHPLYRRLFPRFEPTSAGPSREEWLPAGQETTPTRRRRIRRCCWPPAPRSGHGMSSWRHNTAGR